MNFFILFLQKIFRKELSKPLGRWKIEHCNKKIKLKVDRSNEDHCGPCGQSHKFEKKEK